jgi:CPA2 family monovalent cation:H+ antiporter-2
LGFKDHVIVCGYGRSGQNLVAMLATEKIKSLAVDLDPELIEATSKTTAQKAVFGDATRAATLHALGLNRAKAVVITFIDTAAALRILSLVKEHAPQIPVIVRTRDDQAIERLQAAGATEVVPDALEGSLMLASHALAVVGVPMRRVIRAVQDQRSARYALLRNYYDENEDGHH